MFASYFNGNILFLFEKDKKNFNKKSPLSKWIMANRNFLQTLHNPNDWKTESKNFFFFVNFCVKIYENEEGGNISCYNFE